MRGRRCNSSIVSVYCCSVISSTSHAARRIQHGACRNFLWLILSWDSTYCDLSWTVVQYSVQPIYRKLRVHSNLQLVVYINSAHTNTDVVLPICDISIRSGDIGDRNLRLSEIAPNFKRFLPSQILWVRSPKSCSHVVMPASRHVTWKSFVRSLPLAAKLQARIRGILGYF